MQTFVCYFAVQQGADHIEQFAPGQFHFAADSRDHSDGRTIFAIEERGQGWAVIDKSTEQVALIKDAVLDCLVLKDAEDLASLLNLLERYRPRKLN